MKKIFALDGSDIVPEEKMPQSELFKYMKNDGYDDHRKKIWNENISITQFENALAQTELYIKDLIEAEMNKPVDLNVIFNRPGKGPLEDRVIILPDPAKKITAGGLQIIEQQQQSPPQGTVISVGPGIPSKMNNTLVGYLKDGVVLDNFADGAKPIYELEAMPLKPGMKVLYGRAAGLPIEDPETKKKYLVMRLADVFIIA